MFNETETTFPGIAPRYALKRCVDDWLNVQNDVNFKKATLWRWKEDGLEKAGGWDARMLWDNLEPPSTSKESKNKIESWIQKTVDSFAFPNGSFSKRDFQMLNQKGFQLSFTTEPKYLTEASLNEMYRLPRFEVLDNVSFAENICRMSGVWFQRSFLKSR